MTITSPQNEKLKLVRKLGERKQREREGLFVSEGEDLLQAGLDAGAEPRFVLSAADTDLTIPVPAASGVAVEQVEPALLSTVSSLGSGTRVIAVWPLRWANVAAAPCVYLHGVGDPGNVGTILRSVDALLGGTTVLGPDCADPFSPKAVRAAMGSTFARPPLRAQVGETPGPRVALVAHGGAGLDAIAGAATICLGAEREGLPAEVFAECEAQVTIPLRRGGAESLSVGAAAAIACQWLALAGQAPERISSPTMSEAEPDA